MSLLSQLRFACFRQWRLGLGAIILASQTVMAQPPDNCACLWQGSFSQAYSHADFVVLGEVVTSKGNSADIAIERRFFHNPALTTEYNDVIRLWGDNGKLCRPSIANFPLGSRWVLAMHRIVAIPEDGFDPDTPNISFGRKGDYSISSCGAFWLRVHDGFVTGNLVNGGRWNWDNPDMNPVLIELVKAYIDGVIPERALAEAAKPPTAAKKLMEETREFIRQQ